MKRQSESGFNVVLVGTWNPSIFQPDWVKEHLSLATEGDVIMEVSLGSAPLLIPRLTFDDLFLLPRRDRLEVAPRSLGANGFAQAARCAWQAIEKLPHTPLTAAGINFRFSSDDDFNRFDGLFDLADASRIDTAKYVLMGSVISRSFRVSGEPWVLNLNIRREGDEILCEFNFHLPYSGVSGGSVLLKDFLSSANVSHLEGITREMLANQFEVTLNE